MNPTNAMSGWQWMKDALQLFKMRPFELIFSVFGLLLCSLVLGSIPLAGPVAAFLCGPLLAVGVAQACRQVQAGQSANAAVLFVAFRSPARNSLLILGLAQFVATVISLYLASLVDDGFFAELYQNPQLLDAKQGQDMAVTRQLYWRFLQSFALSRLMYVPAMMAFWFTPYLIMWHGMSASKASFYSFFAVWRARMAFLTYFFTCIALLMGISLGLGLLASLNAGIASVINALSFPLMILLVTVFYCSFYTSYSAVFDRAETVV
ncbi:MAG: hypothetical protein HY253_08110 [Burkholderiales bacterium]|nr:hypothetical protein [Burkholderiales bacterium]